jgi:hypothetical protein
LSCEAAPVGNGKQFGKARHVSKKMILPCACGPISGVCAIDVWWSVLDASLFCGNNIRSSKQNDVYGASNIILPYPGSLLIFHLVEDVVIISKSST